MAASFTESELSKLLIIPCKDPACTQEVRDEQFEVMYNPSSLAVKLKIERDEQQADGETSSSLNVKRLKPQDYSFEFVIDGTGANGLPKKKVADEVEKFLKAVYEMKGDEHQPRYLKILYGAVLLKCALKSVDVTYNLFAADATPLRAKINASFGSCSDQELTEMINKRSSPDLTHSRQVKESDRLISMCNTIYKNNLYYLEVARANGLNQFRKLPDGSKLLFPPVEK